jgi:hypothetical protein
MTSDYIIDFERVNELTAHPNDDPSKTNGYATPFTYAISRKLLKEYIDIYVGYDPSEVYKMGNKQRRVEPDQYENIVNTLKYNKVLISSADIRDKKIDKVLEKN